MLHYVFTSLAISILMPVSPKWHLDSNYVACFAVFYYLIACISSYWQLMYWAILYPGIKVSPSLWWRANARNVSFITRTSLRWPIYIFNLLDITKLPCYPHRCSTTVSLETFTIYPGSWVTILSFSFLLFHTIYRKNNNLALDGLHWYWKK